MQIYGEIDACHMGDRAVMGDNFTEYPLVRFKSQTAAENALTALKAGQVYLDGIPLKGEWRGGTRRPNRRGEEVKESMPPPAPVDETTSRDLKPEKRARSASPRRRKRSRSRSRSRRRRNTSPRKEKAEKTMGSLSINTLAALLGSAAWECHNGHATSFIPFNKHIAAELIKQDVLSTCAFS
eukprot:g33731.t1